MPQPPRAAQQPASDLERYTKAVSEGRFQTALELAKSLHKAAPTAQSLERLRNATLGRGRQLRQQKLLRDAVTILNQMVPLVADRPDLAQALAEEFALCGEPDRAAAVMPGVVDPKARARLAAHAADAAFAAAATGKLPPNAPEDLKSVVAAFADLEAGRDDDARNKLAAIGFTSHYAEYRLMLRGLQAYYANDDARARDNWGRLDPARLPAKWVAAYRAAIDPGYRDAQPPAVQSQLRKQIDTLQPTTSHELRAFARQLENHRLDAAFRTLGLLLPRLRAQMPDLVPKLADCVRGAIIHHGHPADLDKVLRLFGPPPDDPDLLRVEAIALEERRMLLEANLTWEKYEKWLAGSPRFGDLKNRARALIWERMGRNAFRQQDWVLEEIAAELGGGLPPPPKMKPPADACYRKAIALAPDLKSARDGLVELFLETRQNDDAVAAMRDLLAHYPDDLFTLRKLAELLQKSDAVAGREYARRALAQNPLDRELRAMAASSHRAASRVLMASGDFAAARADFAAALDLGPETAAFTHAASAVLEHLAGRPEAAEQSLAAGFAAARHRMEVVYAFMVDATRAKLAKKLRAASEAEFAAALKGPTDPATVLALADGIWRATTSGREYYGAKTHAKKIQTLFDKALSDRGLTEDDFIRACEIAREMKWHRAFRKAAESGHHRFPKNPVLTFALARSYASEGPGGRNAWRLMDMLKETRRQLETLPAERRDPKLTAELDELQKLFGAANPFLSILHGFDGDDDDDSE